MYLNSTVKTVIIGNNWYFISSQKETALVHVKTTNIFQCPVSILPDDIPETVLVTTYIYCHTLKQLDTQSKKTVGNGQNEHKTRLQDKNVILSCTIYNTTFQIVSQDGQEQENYQETFG